MFPTSSQCPCIFTTMQRTFEHGGLLAKDELLKLKLSQVSALVYLPYKLTTSRTFACKGRRGTSSGGAARGVPGVGGPGVVLPSTAASLAIELLCSLMEFERALHHLIPILRDSPHSSFRSRPRAPGVRAPRRRSIYSKFSKVSSQFSKVSSQFSKVSALLHLLYQVTIESTF